MRPRKRNQADHVTVLLTVLVCLWQAPFVSSVSIIAPGDVVAGRPFILQCKITRPTGDTSFLLWNRFVDQMTSRIYATINCTLSIQLSPSSPAGLSGGCQHVNGEEVYTMTIENVTEDTGRGRWICYYGTLMDTVTLNITVMVTEVTLRNPPDTVLAGDSISFTCVTSASKPQACIRAYIRSSGNIWEVDPGDCNQNSSSVQATTRTLTFTASAEENGAELYCNASNRVTDRPVRSQVYTLNVQYAPVILCNASHVTVFERQRVKISCDVISNPEGPILWVKDGRPVDDASINNFRGPTRRDVTVATIEFGQADKSLAGTYHIEARNSVGSLRMEVSVTVIDGEYIPREIGIKSCSNNQATLFWASGVDDSLVEYYNLEYRENGESWKTELVRNPGKFNLVQTTLPDVRSGVFYQFRLQPVSAMFSLEYVTANCTILNSQTCEGLSSTPETGLSKAAMLGVGLVAGIALVSLAVVMVTCWLLRRGRLTYHKELRESDKQTADHDISMQGVAEDIEQPEPPPLGHYEELDTSLRSGTHYEDLSGNVSSSITSDTRLYENATVM